MINGGYYEGLDLAVLRCRILALHKIEAFGFRFLWSHSASSHSYEEYEGGKSTHCTTKCEKKTSASLLPLPDSELFFITIDGISPVVFGERTTEGKVDIGRGATC
jgi:hypothetical protein